jgi:NADPH:quinone reductase-like Zn-dependent oxidoreductase
MRAVQITEFGGPRSSTSSTCPIPVPGDGEQLHEVSATGVDYADTRHRLSAE